MGLLYAYTGIYTTSDGFAMMSRIHRQIDNLISNTVDYRLIESCQSYCESKMILLFHPLFKSTCEQTCHYGGY